MTPILVYNPRAGYGRSQDAAERLAWSLRGAGHDPRLVATGPGQPTDELPARLAQRSAPDPLVVVGGDGTLHHLLPLAIAHAAPLYHVPLGAENLFAREFGMDRSPSRLIHAIARGRTIAVDAGEFTPPSGPPLPFAVMLSVGPDAEVIRAVAASRSHSRHAIGHLRFVLPVLGQALRPHLPRITLDVDGRRLVNDEPGLLVVANSRQYALRLNPAANASMTDGLIDAVFLPCRTSVTAAGWLVRSAWRGHLSNPRLVYATGRRCDITARHERTPPRAQADGEPLAPPGPASWTGTIAVRPGALRVLLP